VRIVDVDDVAVGVDRVIEVLHFVGVDLGHRRVELDLDRPLEGDADVPVVRVDEIEPLAQAPVAPLESDQGRLVRRIDLEHLLESCSRELGLHELLFLNRGELHQDIDALALARDDVELLLENTDEVLPARLLGVDALEASHRGQRTAVHLEHLAVGLGGPIGVAEVVLVERGDPELVRRDGLRVLQRLHLAREDVAELLVHRARRVDALEGLESGQMQRIDLEGTRVVRERLVDSFICRSSSSPKSVRISLRSRSVVATSMRAGQRLAELLPLAVLAVEASHLPQDGHVVRIELDDLRVVGLRVLGVPQIFAVPLGQTQAEADALLRILLALEPGVGVLNRARPAPRRLRHTL